MSTFTSRSQLLPNVAGLFMVIPTFIGIRGLLQPRAVLESVEFPVPATLEAQKLADALIRLSSARNTVIGLLCLAIRYKGDRKLLGSALIIVSFFPVIDAFVSYDLTGGGLSHHLPVIPILTGLGAGLLGWLG